MAHNTEFPPNYAPQIDQWMARANLAAYPMDEVIPVARTVEGRFPMRLEVDPNLAIEFHKEAVDSGIAQDPYRIDLKNRPGYELIESGNKYPASKLLMKDGKTIGSLVNMNGDEVLIYIEPEHRGKGLGKDLLQAGIDLRAQARALFCHLPLNGSFEDMGLLHAGTFSKSGLSNRVGAYQESCRKQGLEVPAGPQDYEIGDISIDRLAKWVKDTHENEKGAALMAVQSLLGPERCTLKSHGFIKEASKSAPYESLQDFSLTVGDKVLGKNGYELPGAADERVILGMAQEIKKIGPQDWRFEAAKEMDSITVMYELGIKPLAAQRLFNALTEQLVNENILTSAKKAPDAKIDASEIPPPISMNEPEINQTPTMSVKPPIGEFLLRSLSAPKCDIEQKKSRQTHISL